MAVIKPTGTQQLPMFMTGADLHNSITRSTDGINLADVWDRKLAEAKRPFETGEHGAGVYESVQREGVQNPISLVHREGHIEQYEGHHRAISAYSADANRLVPVVHSNNFDGYHKFEQQSPSIDADIEWQNASYEAKKKRLYGKFPSWNQAYGGVSNA